MTNLPYIDEHSVFIRQPRDVAWAALDGFARGLGFGRGNPLAALLGTQPRGGFAVAESVPGERLSLEGRHHFSIYRLVFELGPSTPEGIKLSAHSYGEFPGLRGRVYRALVIGTHGHAIVTDQLVRSIRRRADTLATEQQVK
jgi:hypothetical protein